MSPNRYQTVIQKMVFIFLPLPVFLSFFTVTAQIPHGYNYAVVISEAAYGDAGWKTVADSLVKKHGRSGTAKLFTWPSSVTSCKSELAAFQPDYIGYIARPATECKTAFVVAVSRMSRELDDDPYGDAVWGIITGYEAADALRAISEKLTVKTVLAASNNLSYEPPIQRFYQGIGMTCDDSTKTDYLFPGKSGKVYTENKRPQGVNDRINLVGPWLAAQSLDIEVAGQGRIEGPVDCIITGGHGNVNVWQCHYSDAGTEGYMRSSGGKLYGEPYSGSRFEIQVATPTVFWCATNCLMGNPDSRDNFVYAAFHGGHAVQMFGFIINASAGDEFMAWGIYDRVTKFAGKYTLADGFYYANNLAQFEVLNSTGQLQTSLVRTFLDSTVFYGDPAADVRFHDVGDSARAYKESLSYSAGDNGAAQFTYSITMSAHDLEFGAGYCYQFRPITRLPVRIDPATVAITGNDGHAPVITDDLLIWEMLSRGETLKKGDTKTLRWSAVITDEKTAAKASMQPRISTAAPEKMRIVRTGILYTVEVRNLPEGNRELRIFTISGKLLLSKPVADGSVQWRMKNGSGVAVAVVTVNGAVAACREIPVY
ncbi:MAG: hypothetical protein JW863_22795 [Chitinispirillaceae bacterium]|nr:hypothetical protein [Chitinispirillaceae bacterium]